MTNPASRNFPRILIIATWFGPLPDYFPQWMLSCRFNPSIDWLVATDADISDMEPPPNVHFVQISMDDFAARISEEVGFQVAMERPYKACDLRPLYGCLTDLAPGTWDFWGHCDLDMLFGDICAFLTPELLTTNDRVFGVGHFSLYRNDDETNNFFRKPLDGLDYRQILTDPRPRGFDEHIGVNRIWKHHNGRFHEDESVLADIDPNIYRIRRTSNYIWVKNMRHQVFGFNRGRVMRYWLASGQVKSEDFMYVHFQKRRFTLPPPPTGCERFWLTPDGFIPMEEDTNLTDNSVTPSMIRQLSPVPLLPPRKEISHRLRHTIRLLRHHARGLMH
ncbi:DUF6625 family protein [Phaeobacter sp. B1627]|uniref:DUF6625 family protein n=1 Tax=Phaeobacter sp. B1627 TaxID=2583809 RepID=UPI00111808D5|nr:DUF6625 family protein [Phaeobacter sp. B1627]TNJ40968.1 hypothetical protein FGE21_15830 [Phaeobacter sp. B1627]